MNRTQQKKETDLPTTKRQKKQFRKVYKNVLQKQRGNEEVGEGVRDNNNNTKRKSDPTPFRQRHGCVALSFAVPLLARESASPATSKMFKLAPFLPHSYWYEGMTSAGWLANCTAPSATVAGGAPASIDTPPPPPADPEPAAASAESSEDGATDALRSTVTTSFSDFSRLTVSLVPSLRQKYSANRTTTKKNKKAPPPAREHPTMRLVSMVDGGFGIVRCSHSTP